MIKPDELELLKYVAAGFWPRDAGIILKIHYRRVRYLCEKWMRKKWYSCGVSTDLGQLTSVGNWIAYFWWFCPPEDRIPVGLFAKPKPKPPSPWPCSICGLGKVGHILSDEAGLICPCDVVRPTE